MKDNLDEIQMANKYVQIHGKYLHLLVIEKKINKTSILSSNSAKTGKKRMRKRKCW